MFAKTKQRRLDDDVELEFMLEIVGQARKQRLLSEERFSVDGTLLAVSLSFAHILRKSELTDS